MSLMGLTQAQYEAVKKFNDPTENFPTPETGVATEDLHLEDFIEEYVLTRKLPGRHALTPYLTPEDVEHFSQQLFLAVIFPLYVDKALTEANIDGSVSFFYNCREWGLAYSFLTEQGIRTFTVYEHRCYDSIIINGKANWDGEELPYAGNSGDEFFAEFSYQDFRAVLDSLVFFINEAVRGSLEDDATLVAKCERLDWTSIISQQLPFAAGFFASFPSPLASNDPRRQ